MKRFIAVALSLALCMSAVGCSSNDGSGTEATNSTTSETTAASEDATSSEYATSTEDASEAASNDSSGSVSVDEGLLNVDITFPASWFEDSEEPFDADAYAKENGFKKAVQNEDGSITVTMSKSDHKAMLADLAADYDIDIDEMIESEDTPYIKSIERADDFSSFTVQVEREGYESAVIEFTSFILGYTGAMYQAFVGEEANVNISIIDVATGDVLNETTFPE